MWFMTSGDKQLDEAADLFMGAAARLDMAGVIAGAARMRTAIGDLPVAPAIKDDLIGRLDILADETLAGIAAESSKGDA